MAEIDEKETKETIAKLNKTLQVRKQQLELDKNNRLVPNRERNMSRLYIVILLI